MNSTLSLVENHLLCLWRFESYTTRLFTSPRLLDRQPFYNFDIIIYLFLLLFFFFHYHFGVSDGIVYFCVAAFAKKAISKDGGKIKYNNTRK